MSITDLMCKEILAAITNDIPLSSHSNMYGKKQRNLLIAYIFCQSLASTFIISRFHVLYIEKNSTFVLLVQQHIDAVHLTLFAVFSTKIIMFMVCTFSSFQNRWPQRDKPLSTANMKKRQFPSIANRQKIEKASVITAS